MHKRNPRLLTHILHSLSRLSGNDHLGTSYGKKTAPTIRSGLKNERMKLNNLIKHAPVVVLLLRSLNGGYFMKKLHIVLLVGVAVAIAVMISFTTDLSTYDTVASANKKLGKYVHLIAKLDKSQPIEYDAVKNPNYCAFMVTDSLGTSTKVLSNKPKPADLEMSERVVLKGRMQQDGFHCEEILLKCPSKYKDDVAAANKQLQQTDSITAY